MRPVDSLAAWWVEHQAATAAPLGLSTSHISPQARANVMFHMKQARARARGSRLRESIEAVEARRRALAQATIGLEARARPDTTPHAIITEGGAVFRLRVPCGSAPLQGGGKRGAIEYLSDSSRRRLMRSIASINLTKTRGLPLFITLTYPGEYPHEPKTFKRHLDSFLKRLVRAYPQAAGYWRVEPQQRGAPHYHILLYGIPYLPHWWVAQNWYTVVGSCAPEHLAAGTKVEAVRTYNGIMHYVAKYISKRPIGEQPLDWGRLWGIFGRARLPITENVTSLTDEQFAALHRTMRDILEGHGITIRETMARRGLGIFLDSRTATRILILFTAVTEHGPAN